MARTLQESAGPPLDGAAALAQRAVDRLRSAALHVSRPHNALSGSRTTARQSFHRARILLQAALSTLDEIEREHMSE